VRWPEILILVLVTPTTIAHAEPEPLVLAADQIEAALTAELELAPNLVGDPFSIAPDVWLGVTSRWTVGVIHSNASISRITHSNGYCFRNPHGCDRTYHNAGVDVRYGVRTGALAVAPRVRFLVREVDPFKPAVTTGALVRWTRGRWSITGDPYLRFGLANTDQGNRTALFLPVEVAVRPIDRLAFALHTGYDSDLAVWHDGWHTPLALAVRGRIAAHVELGVLAGFTSAVGPQDTMKRRVMWISLDWRS
jgi:hypothetical protein